MSVRRNGRSGITASLHAAGRRSGGNGLQPRWNRFLGCARLTCRALGRSNQRPIEIDIGPRRALPAEVPAHGTQLNFPPRDRVLIERQRAAGAGDEIVGSWSLESKAGGGVTMGALLDR